MSAAAIAAVLGQGWLIGFVLVAAPVMGAVALRMIGALCGGTWSRSAALERLTAFTPWLCLIVLPVLALSPLVFPGPAARPAQLRVYLAPPLIDLRMAVIVGGWSLFAMAMRRAAPGSGRERLTAAMGLAFYGLVIGFAAVDWQMALQPPWISSAGAMSLAVFQLAMALGWSLLVAPAPGTTAGGDLAGLLVATLVATLYFALITYVIPWYSDLPDKTAWFRLRSGWLWGGVMAAALAVGAFVPIVLIAVGHRLFGWVLAYRLAGAGVVAGLTLQAVWTMAPPLGWGAVLFALAPLAPGAWLTLGAIRALAPLKAGAAEAPARWDSVARRRPVPASFGDVVSEQPLLQRHSSEDESREPVPLEPPGVPWRLVVGVGAAALVLLVASQALVLAFWRLSIPGPRPPAVLRADPAPRLEMALSGGVHGAPARAPGAAAKPPRGIAEAEAAVIARGPAACEPPGGKQ
jgi:hypothetical protein